MKDYQTTKNFFRSLYEMTSEERRQVSDFMQKLKDENEDEKFVYYDNVSDLQRNFVFNYQKLQSETGILYIDYINLSIQKYSENFEKINHLFKMVNYGTRMLNDGLINIALDKNEDVRNLTSDYVEKGVQAIEETADVMDNAKDEFEKNKKEILSYLNLLLENEKINVFRSLKSEPLEAPELDFSDNPDKVKLIMLEKLGIIEYIKTIQTKPDTISHTSEILSTITGIDSKTLNSYLYPMLRPYRDDDDKNSPYKNPENIEKAERELIRLKIKNINANR